MKEGAALAGAALRQLFPDKATWLPAVLPQMSGEAFRVRLNAIHGDSSSQPLLHGSPRLLLPQAAHLAALRRREKTMEAIAVGSRALRQPVAS